MEDERVRAQAEASRLEREALESARRQAEARARHERESLEREEVERRQEAERKERETAARVEAMRQAALEAARVEVEARLRAEERDHARRHELEMANASAERRGSVGRRLIMATLTGASAAAIVAASLYVGIAAPGERARAAQSSSELASRDALVADARAETVNARALARSLGDELSAARAESARLQKVLDDVNARATRARPDAGHPNGLP